MAIKLTPIAAAMALLLALKPMRKAALQGLTAKVA